MTCRECCHQWEILGALLNLSSFDLDEIGRNHDDGYRCLCEVFYRWINRRGHTHGSPCNWATLIGVLQY